MNTFTKLTELLHDKAEVRHDVSMMSYTTIRTGGKADIFITPNKISYIGDVVRACNELNLSIHVIGKGSNLIVADRGVRGAVLHCDRQCGRVSIVDDVIYAEAGVYIPTLVSICMKARLQGIEIVTGIPGTLGGAIYMNAGYTKPISNIIKSVTIFRDFQVIQLQRDEIEFGHRTSMFQLHNDIILSAELQLEKGEIKDTVKSYILERKIKQPLHYPNCGSVFKKPGKKVYNLKGISYGNAEYCKGFILNKGGATTDDVLKVINMVRIRAGKQLYLEAELMGEF